MALILNRNIGKSIFFKSERACTKLTFVGFDSSNNIVLEYEEKIIKTSEEKDVSLDGSIDLFCVKKTINQIALHISADSNINIVREELLK